jgi:hypothetical protein
MALYFNAGAGDDNWNNTLDWWTGPNQSGSNDNTPSLNESLFIETPCNQNVPANLQYNLTLYSQLTIPVSSNIPVGSSTNIYTGGSITFTGDLTINGTLNIFFIVSTGSITISSSGVVNVGVDGSWIPSNTLNYGVINLVDTGALELLGSTLTNNNQFNASNNSSIKMRPLSMFINNGTFTFGSTYSTNFKGGIFPQVPSSASWGNALL